MGAVHIGGGNTILVQVWHIECRLLDILVVALISALRLFGTVFLMQSTCLAHMPYGLYVYNIFWTVVALDTVSGFVSPCLLGHVQDL